MDRAHVTGFALMVASALEFVVFVVAALRRSYLALALPVAAAMTVVTALGFWVGWTMMSLEDEPEEPAIEQVE